MTQAEPDEYTVIQRRHPVRSRSGSGVSLRVIHEDLSMEVVPETRGVDGTYTNRFVHFASNQMIIGPHVIDEQHRIRTVPELAPLRICGTRLHMSDPDNVVYELSPWAYDSRVWGVRPITTHLWVLGDFWS